jgi:hypothetical protein
VTLESDFGYTQGGVGSILTSNGITVEVLNADMDAGTARLEFYPNPDW